MSPEAGPAPYQVWQQYAVMDLGSIQPVNLAATMFSPEGPAAVSPTGYVDDSPSVANSVSPTQSVAGPTGSEPIVCSTESEEELMRSFAPSPDSLKFSTPVSGTEKYDSCPPTESPKLRVRRELFVKTPVKPAKPAKLNKPNKPSKLNKPTKPNKHDKQDFSRFITMKNARLHFSKLRISKEAAQAVSALLGRAMERLAEAAKEACKGGRMTSLSVQAAVGGVVPASMAPYAKRGGVRAVAKAYKPK